jgi:hypothetical protein
MPKSKLFDMIMEWNLSCLSFTLLKEFYIKEAVLKLHNKMGEWRGNTSTC